MTVSSENRQHNATVDRRHVFYVLLVAELHDALTRYRAAGLPASGPGEPRLCVPTPAARGSVLRPYGNEQLRQELI